MLRSAADVPVEEIDHAREQKCAILRIEEAVPLLLFDQPFVGLAEFVHGLAQPVGMLDRYALILASMHDQQGRLQRVEPVQR